MIIPLHVLVAVKSMELCESIKKLDDKVMKQGAIYSTLCGLKEIFGEDFEEPLVYFLAHGDNKEEYNESHRR